KESDRLAAVVEIVTALGGVAEACGDDLRVTGRPLRGGELSSRGDHRLALLGAVAGLVCPDGVTVHGFGAAGVSFPGFAGVLGEVIG
ncbi:MAG TPA: 3-phosphoshikimate 1-carboxyvinyltransferase, partial [Thermoleophilia bacterium]|nr:3-phosphoshikimate 1-carboxyvinyltransferase [Thermoleophilia bacterium]